MSQQHIIFIFIHLKSYNIVKSLSSDFSLTFCLLQIFVIIFLPRVMKSLVTFILRCKNSQISPIIYTKFWRTDGKFYLFTSDVVQSVWSSVTQLLPSPPWPQKLRRISPHTKHSTFSTSSALHTHRELKS